MILPIRSTKFPKLKDYTTTFTFDAANQLVSSTCDGVTTRYAYDAAGRLVKEGNKRYTYGYLDKVLSVTDGDTTRTFTYHADGQLASATVGRGDPTAPTSETFHWDASRLSSAATSSLSMSRMSEMRRRSFASKGSRERSEAPEGPARGRAAIPSFRPRERHTSTTCSAPRLAQRGNTGNTPPLRSRPSERICPFTLQLQLITPTSIQASPMLPV